jgi:hypothetical protein
MTVLCAAQVHDESQTTISHSYTGGHGSKYDCQNKIKTPPSLLPIDCSSIKHTGAKNDSTLQTLGFPILELSIVRLSLTVTARFSSGHPDMTLGARP